MRDSIPGLVRSLEKVRATHSSILAWRIPWAEEWSIGLQRVSHGWSDLACMHTPGKYKSKTSWYFLLSSNSVFLLFHFTSEYSLVSQTQWVVSMSTAQAHSDRWLVPQFFSTCDSWMQSPSFSLESLLQFIWSEAQAPPSLNAPQMIPTIIRFRNHRQKPFHGLPNMENFFLILLNILKKQRYKGIRWICAYCPPSIKKQLLKSSY